MTTAALADPSPTVAIIDGVRHVRNSAEPLHGERTLHLEEVWRVDTDDEEELIGTITAALAGPDGTVWLADNQLGQVLVYSAEGRHLKTLSRQGEGPGEIDGPMQLLWMPGGGLGIIDRKPGRITQIDRDGLPISSLRLVAVTGETLASAFLSQARLGGGILAGAGTQFQFGSGEPVQQRFLGIFDETGQERVRLREAPSGFDFQARTFDEQKHWFVDRDLFAIDQTGRIFVANERDRYSIAVHDSDGELDLIIERPLAPRLRTPEEKERMSGGVSMSINGEVVRLQSNFDDYAPAIESLAIAADRRLWVLSGNGRRPEREGILRSYDLFDAEGRFVEVVHLAAEIDEDRDRLIDLHDGRWIVLENLFGAWRDDDQDEAADDDRPLRILCLKGASR